MCTQKVGSNLLLLIAIAKIVSNEGQISLKTEDDQNFAIYLIASLQYVYTEYNYYLMDLIFP